MIINKTQNKTISEQELVCNSAWSQMRGLMFRPQKENLVMIFARERKIGLHNFFVFYPIDVLVLDANRKVVEVKRNFQPFTFWNAKKKGKYVVEIAERVECQVGDQLVIS